MRAILVFRPLAFASALVCACVSAAMAQEAPTPLRLPLPHNELPPPEDGVYFVDDELHFTVDHTGEYVRLRFDNSEEIFYLTSVPAALGGRVLKYDTGETVLAVSGWGGATLYTEDNPGGIAVERMKDGERLDPQNVAPNRIKGLAADLSQRIFNRGNLPVGFTANWDRLAGNDMARLLAAETMRNTAVALERVRFNRPFRSSPRLFSVRIVEADEYGATFDGDTLVVSYAPNLGQAGRPSSRVIEASLRAR